MKKIKGIYSEMAFFRFIAFYASYASEKRKAAGKVEEGIRGGFKAGEDKEGAGEALKGLKNR